MSQNPTNTPPNHSILSYSSAQPPSIARALTSMILGILSLPLLFAYGLGLLSAIVAIVLGFSALSSIGKTPFRYAGRGLAIAGIATGGGVFLVVTVLLIVLIPIAIELSYRSECAAHLRAITQSMLIYSCDNDDCYPYLGPSKVVARPPLDATPGGLMNDMFVLVSNGQVVPKQFTCLSDPARIAGSSPVGAYWNNPAGGDPNFCFSYSFAFQYSAPDKLGNWWHNTVDAGLPIVADMNPGTQSIRGKTVRNSLNHKGDGQVVGFADAHAEFVRSPTCGEADDHIYNIGPKQPPTSPGTGGLLYPTPAGNTMGTFDTCLQPLITNTTTYTRG